MHSILCHRFTFFVAVLDLYFLTFLSLVYLTNRMEQLSPDLIESWERMGLVTDEEKLNTYNFCFAVLCCCQKRPYKCFSLVGEFIKVGPLFFPNLTCCSVPEIHMALGWH